MMNLNIQLFGGRGAFSSVTTKAKIAENMNEAQLKQEISRRKEKIKRLEKYLSDNDATKISKNEKEYFPLGVGEYKGIKQLNKMGKETERTVQKASRYVKTLNEIESLKKQQKSLEKSYKNVKGTGKTGKQLINEANKGFKPQLKWTTSKEKTQFGSMTVRKSGNYSIKSTEGTHFIYKGTERVGMTDKLSKAKQFVEIKMKRDKK